ncbi:MAG: hypothetical protein M1166_02450 [Candidatus Thermoplasmatota archaeon]|jgi:hypothetical protein|nr:hypothetical protein [Candidatus Thermoplasmatota archaeon]
MTEYDEVVRELRKLSKILLFSNGRVIEEGLSRLITTTERRKMWVLADGTKLPVEIAKIVNVTPMSVSRFLSLTVSAGVIEYERGKPPTRILDYVPAEWVDLLTTSDMTTQQVSEQGSEQNGT